MAHIRIVSPSGYLDSNYIEGAATRLRLWGHTVTFGAHTYAHNGRFAGSDEERLSDLIDAFSDPIVDVLLCARGGYGLQRIIDKLPQHPKHMPLLVGFSDVTLLHQYAYLHHTHSLHTIMCKHIATLPESSEPIRLLQTALQQQSLSYSLPPYPLNRCGQVTASIIGGNLSVLYGLQATPWSLLNTMGSEHPILFLEDIGERHYHVDRMMRNLTMSGVMAQISGLILGQFTDCDDDEAMGCTLLETIRQTIPDSTTFPILFNFPAGHTTHNLPLWLGRTASLHVDTEGATLYYE